MPRSDKPVRPSIALVAMLIPLVAMATRSDAPAALAPAPLARLAKRERAAVDSARVRKRLAGEAWLAAAERVGNASLWSDAVLAGGAVARPGGKALRVVALNARDGALSGGAQPADEHSAQRDGCVALCQQEWRAIWWSFSAWRASELVGVDRVANDWWSCAK